MSNVYRMNFPFHASTALLAAGVTGEYEQVVSLPSGDRALMTKARFMPATGVTAHASNNADVSIDINATEVASAVTTSGGTGSLTAGTEIELTLSGSLEVEDGDRITVKKTPNGTGVVLYGEMTLEFSTFRAA